MVNSLDMQDLRYLNLFEKITRVNTRHVFKYNDALIFCVPGALVLRSIGENSKNLKKLNEIVGRRIKVVAQPQGNKDIKKFIEAIISPIKFKDVEINENEIIVNAGKMNKAALIGRDKRRLIEMQHITESFFKKDFKVV